MNNYRAFLHLLQLSSPTLPLGAYSYSEGLETLVVDHITDADKLAKWLTQELTYGAIRTESAVMLRGYRYQNDLDKLTYWNDWLTASKETSELRQQSRQMGKSLMQLFSQLINDNGLTVSRDSKNLNFPLAFGFVAAYWQIEEEMTLNAYLHSWASNLINAGVRLIPLGQTAGQKILQQINFQIEEIYQDIVKLEDNEIYSCTLGLSLASMNHEDQYTRLFRS
jgi:urease accessory protein